MRRWGDSREEILPHESDRELRRTSLEPRDPSWAARLEAQGIRAVQTSTLSPGSGREENARSQKVLKEAVIKYSQKTDFG